MSDIFTKLAAPFPPDRISWRVGSTTQDKKKGMALAYIDARDVMQRLDDVCGPGGWQCRYTAIGTKTCCEIGVVVKDTCIWKADGAGDTDFEAEKGAFSDAFKRAAVRWGIGRYLYDVSAPWVAIVQAGKSYAIADSEMPKLQKLLPGSKAHTAPEPKNAPGISDARAWIKEHLKELEDCGDSEAFLEIIKAARTRWVRICAVYPGVWTGPEQSGLLGMARKFSQILLCRQELDALVKDVEAAAAELNQQQKAAE